MKTKELFYIVIAAGMSLYACTSKTTQQTSVLLRDNWAIQSSKDIGESGPTISAPSWQPEKWYPATVPSTVFGTLVQNKVYPDPYFGTNIQKIPGYIARRAGEIPDDSPFKAAWWYRTVFSLPDTPRASESSLSNNDASSVPGLGQTFSLPYRGLKNGQTVSLSYYCRPRSWANDSSRPAMNRASSRPIRSTSFRARVSTVVCI